MCVIAFLFSRINNLENLNSMLLSEIQKLEDNHMKTEVHFKPVFPVLYAIPSSFLALHILVLFPS